MSAFGSMSTAHMIYVASTAPIIGDQGEEQRLSQM